MSFTRSKKAPCEICSKKQLSKKSELYKLKSGNTHLRKYLPADDKLIEFNDVKMKPEIVYLEGLKPNTTFFYFATNPRDFTLPILKFVDAYDKLQNSGVNRTSANGKAEVLIGCPQIYLAEDGNIYSRHFHIIYWNKANKQWGTTIYTHQIFCNVNKSFVKKMLNNPKVVILDALSEDMFTQNHIPGAINLPASHKWTLSEITARLPKGTNTTTPMILYCYNTKCNAAEKLWKQLNHLGYYNTMHYSGGITEWTK